MEADNYTGDDTDTLVMPRIDLQALISKARESLVADEPTQAYNRNDLTIAFKHAGA
jgi:hypothetical protein